MSATPFIAACLRQPAAHTPVWYMRQAGRCLPEYRALKEKHNILTLARTPELATEISLMPIHRFGVDAAILFADIMLPLIGMGVDLEIVETIGPVIADPIKDERDVAKLRGIDPADFEYLTKTIRMIKRELAGKIPLIGFSGAPFTLASYLIEGKPTRDFIKTKQMMYGDPAAWSKLMRKLTDVVIDYLKLQTDAGVDAIQIFDSWVGCLSKEDYVAHVLPYSRELFAAIDATKTPRIHFGTNTTAFLEEFASVECEVVGVDWRLSLDDAWKKIGAGKAIQGNLDPIVVLGDFDLVKQKVDDIFARLPRKQGFIFNLGHGVLPDTPYENLIKLTEYVHAK
jgi:uroporphyrinogen decarboxylase